MKLMTRNMYSRRGSIPRSLRGFTPNTTHRWGLLNTEKGGGLTTHYYYMGTPLTKKVLVVFFISFQQFIIAVHVVLLFILFTRLRWINSVVIAYTIYKSQDN